MYCIDSSGNIISVELFLKELKRIYVLHRKNQLWINNNSNNKQEELSCNLQQHIVSFISQLLFKKGTSFFKKLNELNFLNQSLLGSIEQLKSLSDYLSTLSNSRPSKNAFMPNYYKMNNLTNTQKQLFQMQQIMIPISDLSLQYREKRLSQGNQSPQTRNGQKQGSSPQQQNKDFPLIFTKRKREEYSGYKQLNLNKCQLVKFDQAKRQRLLKSPERKYEVNLKNIMKLKKRYSLEPTYFKTLYKQENKIQGIKELKLQIQSNRNMNENIKQNKLRQLMKNILLQHNIQKNSPIQYSHQYSGFSSQRLTEHSKMADFERYKSQMRQENGKRSAEKTKNLDNEAKLSLQKKDNNKRQSKKKDRIYIKTEAAEGLDQTNNQMQKQLCGWQNKTLYELKSKTFLRNQLFIRKKQKQ